MNIQLELHQLDLIIDCLDMTLASDEDIGEDTTELTKLRRLLLEYANPSKPQHLVK